MSQVVLTLLFSLSSVVSTDLLSGMNATLAESLPSVVGEAHRVLCLLKQDEEYQRLINAYADPFYENSCQSPEHTHSLLLRANAFTRDASEAGLWYETVSRLTYELTMGSNKNGNALNFTGSTKKRKTKKAKKKSTMSSALKKGMAIMSSSESPNSMFLNNVLRKLSPDCPFERTISCDPQDKYRTADGTCNNLNHPEFGAAEMPFRRFMPALYQDLFGKPRHLSVSGSPLSSPRLISRTVHTHSRLSDSAADTTAMLMQWGQFIDHDVTLTPIMIGKDGKDIMCCNHHVIKHVGLDIFQMLQRNGVPKRRGQEEYSGPCFPIDIPQGDSVFKRACMEFVRSSPVPNKHCQFGPREQMNRVTAFVDGSPIYGNHIEEQLNLRTLSGGLMNISIGDDGRHYLPFFLDSKQEECFAADPLDTSDNKCFKAGDERVNEMPGLTSLHTLFVREHNRIANILASANNEWEDERLFQESRRIVIAEIQAITFRAFLPLVVGQQSLVTEEYDLSIQTNGFFQGYDPDVDASIRNSFSTAAYRFGHSLIQDFVQRVNDNYEQLSVVNLRDALFHPSFATDTSQGGTDAILRGLVNLTSQKMDHKFTMEIRDHLFEDKNPDGSLRQLGMDLISLNLQRGRDHGIPPYVVARQFCGLDDDILTTFNGLKSTHKRSNIQLLKKVYSDVEDIDLFTGGTTERPLPDAVVGPTFACLIARQFALLKTGDRFYFENEAASSPGVADTGFNAAQLEQLRGVTLSGILCANNAVSRVQPNAFLAATVSGNSMEICDDIQQIDLSKFI